MYNVINPGIFPKNEEDAKALVTSAAYAPFRSNWYSGLYASSQGGIHVISDMSTDIGDCQWDDAVWPDMIQMNFTANSGGLTTTYSTYIRDISKMTLTMERIVNVPMNEEVKHVWMQNCIVDVDGWLISFMICMVLFRLLLWIC